jgi:hypothetical protein
MHYQVTPGVAGGHATITPDDLYMHANNLGGVVATAQQVAKGPPVLIISGLGNATHPSLDGEYHRLTRTHEGRPCYERQRQEGDPPAFLFFRENAEEGEDSWIIAGGVGPEWVQQKLAIAYGSPLPCPTLASVWNTRLSQTDATAAAADPDVEHNWQRMRVASVSVKELGAAGTQAQPTPKAYIGIGAWHTRQREKFAFMSREHAILEQLWKQDGRDRNLTWVELWELGWRCAIVYRSTNVVNVDRMEAALQELYDATRGPDGTPVNLTVMVGAGTANGSFDREGYIVYVTYNINGPDLDLLGRDQRH